MFYLRFCLVMEKYELWLKFLKGVNKLRHGLLDEERFQEFENFVLKETAKDIAG